MKKIIIIAGVSSLFFTACLNTKLATYSDDVYASPGEARKEQARLAAEKKKQEEEEARKKQEALAAQKAKDDANPYYKEPDYSKDDYYDYQYASRLRRFNNPVSGLGYYDNYYTNYYWYNNNPAYYGTSIYSSYNVWNPGYTCSSYNGWSIGTNYSYGYSPYMSSPFYGSSWGNPYSNAFMAGYSSGYNMGFNNGLYYPFSYNYGYNPYGYSNGYNPYGSNGWGYYNSYDVNSGYNKTYAPRGSHDGGNGVRSSNPLAADGNSFVSKYFEAVQQTQDNSPKFDQRTYKAAKSVGNLTDVNNSSPVYYNNSGNIQNNGYSGSSTPRHNVNSGSTQNVQINNSSVSEINNNSGNPKNIVSNPTTAQPVKINEPKNNGGTRGNIFESGTSVFGSGSTNSSSSPSNNSTQRGGGSSGGGSGRPR